jgi:hypothetical protein
MLDEPTTAVSIDTLVAKTDDVRKRAKGLVVVDARRVDELNAHGSSHVTLKLEEANARRSADGVVENQDA